MGSVDGWSSETAVTSDSQSGQGGFMGKVYLELDPKGGAIGEVGEKAQDRVGHSREQL